MAFGGALLGAIPGLFVGLVVGLTAAAVSALAGAKSGTQGPTENVYVQFPVAGLGTPGDFALRTRMETVLDAELKSFGGGQCGGGDMGTGKATVFLTVRDPASGVGLVNDDKAELVKYGKADKPKTKE